ncbi:hypothetical protein L9F63_023419, partial [Diploptera punctata]
QFLQVPTTSEDDDDLEALRLAALQTLRSKPSSINSNHVTDSVVQQQMLHDGEDSNDKSASGAEEEEEKDRDNDLEALRLAALQTLRSKPSSINLNHVTDSVVQQQMLHDGEDSNDKSASGAEEEEEKDRDVLIVIEDSFDKLISELEEEMKKDDSNVPESNNVNPNPESQKKTRSSVFKSKSNACDSKTQKGQGGVSALKAVSVSSNSVKDCDVLTVEENSLDKLISKLEEEVKKDDSNVPESNNVNPNPESQKKTRSSVFKSKSNACDSKTQGGVSTLKTVSDSSNSAKEKKKKTRIKMM